MRYGGYNTTNVDEKKRNRYKLEGSKNKTNIFCSKCEKFLFSNFIQNNVCFIIFYSIDFVLYSFSLPGHNASTEGHYKKLQKIMKISL